MNTPFRQQRGFSLLEVLVTVLVISLGLLGVSSLQTVGLKNTHSAHLRAQAAQYAYDMVDRMRANRKAAVETASYDREMDGDAPTGTSLADKDVVDWLAQLGSLPQGDGAIVVTNAGMATVTVRWNESAMGNTDSDDECPVPQAGEVCFKVDTLI